MATIQGKPHRVNRVDLKQTEELDEVLQLMYYGLRGMTRRADEYLARYGLSRTHHRILFVIARRPGLSVFELVGALGVSKQALHGPLRLLLDLELVASDRHPEEHRQKALTLTAKGKRVEREASERERSVMLRAFTLAGEGSRESWCAVMRAVADDA
jgi:DNA-binding MarR family transcriptional regulator